MPSCAKSRGAKVNPTHLTDPEHTCCDTRLVCAGEREKDVFLEVCVTVCSALCSSEVYLCGLNLVSQVSAVFSCPAHFQLYRSRVKLSLVKEKKVLLLLFYDRST